MLFRRYILQPDENDTQDHQRLKRRYKLSFGPNYACYGRHVKGKNGPVTQTPPCHLMPPSLQVSMTRDAGYGCKTSLNKISILDEKQTRTTTDYDRLEEYSMVHGYKESFW